MIYCLSNKFKLGGLNMKNKASILALIISMLMLISILSGCATTTTTSTTASSQSTEATESSATTTKAPEGKVELTYLVPTRVFIQDMATNDFTLWMEEQTNVHVTWQSIPQQGAEEKLAVIMASEDLPDVLFSCPITNAMLAKYGVEEQIFMPLDDLIASAVNLQKAASKSPGGLDVLRQIDGKLYSLPTFDTCQHCEQATKVWLYDPFVQKLGIEYPKTTEEFYQFLKKVQATDLNDNGKNDEVPFAGAASGWHNRVEEFLMNSFLYYDYGANGFFLKDGKIDSSLDKEEYREGLRFIKKLYDEKLIYEASLTQDSPTLVKLTEGSEDPVLAAATGGWVGMFANFGEERAKGFHTLAPLTGPNGFVTTPNYPSLPWQGAFVLSSNCRNPEAAIKYADLLYSKDATLWTRAGGAKDNFYRDAEDGEKDFYGNQAVWAPLKAWNDTEPQNHSWISLGVWDYTELRASRIIGAKKALNTCCSKRL